LSVIARGLLLIGVTCLSGGGPALGGLLPLDLFGKVGYIGSKENIISWHLSMGRSFTSRKQRSRWERSSEKENSLFNLQARFWKAKK
jgi:hypothetical protein